MKLLQEFKQFVMRGNVMDLAIAVIIGAAFGKIITALVEGIIMPLLGLVLGKINLANEVLYLGETKVQWGLFLQSIIDFTIIAFFIFIAIKGVNALQQKQKEEPAKQLSNEAILLTEIRDLMKSSNQKS